MEMPDEIYVYNRNGRLEARDCSIVVGNESYHHCRVVEAIRRENDELRSDNERMKKTGIFLHDWTLKHETLEKYCSIKDAIEQGSKCGDSFIETLTKCAIRMLELKAKLDKAKDALVWYRDDFGGRRARTTLEELGE